MPPTRDRILDSAERLFAEKGYEATTLRDVAAEVGIQNPSLYKHFASKADIYAAVLDRAVRPILDEFWDTEDEIENVVALLAEHPTACRLILREMLGGGSQLRPLVIDRFEELIERTRSFLRDRHSRAPAKWNVTLRVLAISHMMIGLGASADFHRELTGRELSSKASLRMQEDLVAAVSRALRTSRPPATARCSSRPLPDLSFTWSRARTTRATSRRTRPSSAWVQRPTTPTSPSPPAESSWSPSS